MEPAFIAVVIVAVIGAGLGRGSDMQAVTAIAYYVAFVIGCVVVGYLLDVNPTKIMAFVGVGIIATFLWAVLAPSKPRQ